MEYLVDYIFVLFFIFLIEYVYCYIYRIKKKQLNKNKGLSFIVNKYNLKLDMDKKKLLTKILIGLNSFIISIPIYLALVLDTKYSIYLVISCIALMFILFALYNLLGSYLKKKGW